MAYPAMLPAYGVQTPYEFLQLTGAKVSLKHASEKLISVSQLNINNQQNVRTASPGHSTPYSQSSSDGHRVKYNTDVTKNDFRKDSAGLRDLRHIQGKSDATYNNFNALPKRFGSPKQQHIHSSRTDQGLQGFDPRFILKSKGAKLESLTELQRLEKPKVPHIEKSAKFHKPDAKRSRSVRDLVANILHSVMNKTSNAEEIDQKSSANDVNNNLTYENFKEERTTYNTESPTIAKINEWESKDHYSQFTRSQSKVKSSKKKKSKKLKATSPQNMTDTPSSRIDSLDCTFTISKANTVISNLSKRNDSNRSRSLSHSNAVAQPFDMAKRSPCSPIQRRKSLDLDAYSLGRQSIPQNRIPYVDFRRTNDDVHKVLKVYQSQKQTNAVHDMGENFVGAPPTTPMPEMLHKVQYIPCMADIKAQRAVKAELEMLQRKEHKRHEKEMEEKRLQEKVIKKETEKRLRARQRQEIYALNKIMTELEHDNFKKFCKANAIPS